jgi:hypothetical protein
LWPPHAPSRAAGAAIGPDTPAAMAFAKRGSLPHSPRYGPAPAAPDDEGEDAPAPPRQSPRHAWFDQVAHKDPRAARSLPSPRAHKANQFQRSRGLVGGTRVSVGSRTATGVPQRFSMLQTERYDITRAFAQMIINPHAVGVARSHDALRQAEMVDITSYAGKERTEDTMHQAVLLRKLRALMASARVTTADDWVDLFRRYDRNDSGGLEQQEFIHAVRR